MAIFPTTGCTIDAVLLSEEEKAVMNQVTNGNAFINPDKPAIEGASASISNTLTMISGAADSGIFSTLTTSLNTLRGNLTSYVSHSDRLSGVNLGATGPSAEPGLSGLLGVAKAYNTVCESVTGGTKDNFSPLFNSILGPGEFKLNRAEEKITTEVKHFVSIHRGLAEANSIFNTQLAVQVSTVNSLSTDIGGLITTDNSSFETANQTVRNYNIGNALVASSSDPCFTGKLVDRISSGSMKEKLDAIE